VTVLRQVDGSTLVTWVSHSINEDGFVVRRQELDGTWDVVGLASAGTTSVVIPPPSEAIADTGDYDVGAYSFVYTNANYSEETNPATIRYAIIDLGQVNPFRVTNSGYVLLSGWYPLHGGQRWFGGQIEDVVGGEIPELSGGIDINESGTVVGSILSSPFTGPNPLNGRAPVSPPAWYEGAGTVRVAARWDVGQADPTLLGPSFSFNISSGPNNTYTGTIKTSYAYAIDNNGDIFGESCVAYQEAPAYFDPDGNFHGTAWGSLYSGYNYTSGTAMGDQSLVPGPDGFTTQGRAAFISKARNGTNIGQLDENNPYNLTLTGTVNGFTVTFTPINLNDYAMVLGRSNPTGTPNPPYDDWLLYDATSGAITKHLGVNALYSYFLPQALNHHQIPAYDSNGQQVMKESPQVVGTDASFGFDGFDGGDIATIWEENPITGNYEMQYLNRLISPSSGWDLHVARDINDDGVIAADGWYQPKDTEGNPVGPRQWRGCLLVPLQVMIVSPVTNASYPFCDDVIFGANVSGAFAASVTRVEYWIGGSKVAESTDPNGWSAVWVRPPKGKYLVTARAFIGALSAYADGQNKAFTVLPITRAGVQLIYDFEVGGGQTYYEQIIGDRPEWPGQKSGITIGIGYDLRHNSPDQIRADWGELLPSDQVERIAQLSGRIGSPALRDSVQDITIPWSIAEQVFYNRTLPRYIADTLSIYPNADTVLSPNDFGALVDMVFNRGASLSDAGRSTKYASDPALEMRQIATALTAGNYSSISASLRNMKRIWPDLPNLPRRKAAEHQQLRQRRDAEADFFDQYFNIYDCQ
jgi:hypothetical protein